MANIVFTAPAPELLTTTFPSPAQGINLSTPLANQDINTCIAARNLTPSLQGLRLRKGFIEHANITLEGVPADASAFASIQTERVRTLIPYTGDGDSSAKLFGVSTTAIYDVSDASATTKSAVYSFPEAKKGTFAGLGTYLNILTGSGEEILLYADPVFGLHYFDGDNWGEYSLYTAGQSNDVRYYIKPPDGDSLAPAGVTGVYRHSSTIWLGTSGSLGYYFGAAAFAGELKAFDFSPFFTSGGALSGIYDWSFNSGSGLEAYFVALSTTGDVLVFSGTSPDTTWGLVSHHKIGRTPAGGRNVTEYGGDLILLSAQGLLSLRELVEGRSLIGDERATLSIPIIPRLRDELENGLAREGWYLFTEENEGHIIVNVPLASVEEYSTSYQLIYNTTTKGWGSWADLPILHAVQWGELVYFSDPYGFVYTLQGSVDFDRHIRPDVDEDVELHSRPVEFSFISAFSGLGQGAITKHFLGVRPYFTSVEDPVYRATIFLDYAFGTPSEPTEATPTSVARWDEALWEMGTWVDGASVSHNQLFGVAGLGRTVCVAVAGSARSRCTLMAIDLQYRLGNSI